MPHRKITWPKRAVKQFNTSIEYIRLQSDQNAGKVKFSVLATIEKLGNNTPARRKLKSGIIDQRSLVSNFHLVKIK